MLKQVFGGEAMSRTQTHEWSKRFKEVQTSRFPQKIWPCIVLQPNLCRAC